MTELHLFDLFEVNRVSNVRKIELKFSKGSKTKSHSIQNIYIIIINNINIYIYI